MNGKIVPIRALLDTGTSATIILRKYVEPGCADGYKGKPVAWSTLGGKFETRWRALIDFAFPELDTQKKSIGFAMLMKQQHQKKPSMI